MFSPLSFEAHKQLANLAGEVQSLRSQVLDSKVACLQSRQACQICDLQAAADYLETSINNFPDEKTLKALRRRLSRFNLLHRELNLDGIQATLTALTDEYDATLHQIEVVQEGLISLVDRTQAYSTAGLIKDFYEFEPQRIAAFFAQKWTEDSLEIDT